MADTGIQPKIARYGDPVLRERTRKGTRVTAEVRTLVEHMVEAMRAAHGVGLAANQLGAAVRLAVVEVEGELTVLIDPEVAREEGSESADEGCLSLPRLYGAVERPARVAVRARDLSGKRFVLEAEGLLARALAHEIDHLNGKLFIDKADPTTLYWLIGHTEEGEPITQPTTLEEALRVFTAAKAAHG